MTSLAYRTLAKFITEKMRMSHIYQPVMLMALIKGNGRATIREIAAAFLSNDESQLEYYAEITKGMPGKVLAKHNVVKRDGDAYRLTVDPLSMSDSERQEIVSLCDEHIDRYRRRRGSAIYDHRRTALGYVPGSLRYEILKRAAFHCELCGVSHEERALEVDHIVPKKHGGQDDWSNLQALCYKCNANKGARDDTHFRAVRESYAHRQADCPFCTLPTGRVVAENALAYAIRDAYPVTHLHTLLIPKRHSAMYLDLHMSERLAIDRLLTECRDEIVARDRGVEGFNLGINMGEVAGQTIFHCHVHLIPRREGDVESPRGGVRGVIPGKSSY